MLFGRQTECAELERDLDAARRGRSAALVIEGEAGVGKTTLIEHARSRALGFRVLACGGVEMEAELPYAGILALLRPVLHLRDAMPEAQRAALEAVLALG